MTEGPSVTAKTLLNFQIAQLVSHPDILVLTMIVDDGEHPFALDRPIALGLSKHLGEYAALRTGGPIPTGETMARPPAAAEAGGIIAPDGNLTSRRPGSIRCRDNRGTYKRPRACRGRPMRRRLQCEQRPVR